MIVITVTVTMIIMTIIFIVSKEMWRVVYWLLSWSKTLRRVYVLLFFTGELTSVSTIADILDKGSGAVLLIDGKKFHNFGGDAVKWQVSL